MSKPIVPLTIIIPAYNRHEMIEQVLNSIVDQDVRPQEVIVVDDCSSPPIKIKNNFFNQLQIRLIRKQKNEGVASARNIGMKESQTDWVSFLDNDDRLISNTLGRRWQEVIDDQRRQEDLKIIYACGWINCTEQDQDLNTLLPNPSSEPQDFASGCWFNPGSCIIINKVSALAETLGQDVSITRLEDLDWFLDLGQNGFKLKVIEVIGARIERKRLQEPSKLLDASNYLVRKWKSRRLDPTALRCLKAYLDLESAAACYYKRQPFRTFARLLRSFIRKPGSVQILCRSFQKRKYQNDTEF